MADTILFKALHYPSKSCSELVYWFNDVVIFGSDCDRFSSDNKGTGNP